MQPVYVLGGYQTDFAIKWSRLGKGLFDIFSETTQGALADAELAPADIEAGHVGNFASELFCGQGHLGGFFASVDPDFAGLAATRHEAACASGSVAVLGALAAIQAGHQDVALVVGVEEMRNVGGGEAARHLGAAAWQGREASDARYPWPYLFSEVSDAYSQRYGLDDAHLGLVAKQNFAAARKNPNAQTRGWEFSDSAFDVGSDDNPVVEGRIRRLDCAQITDGGAGVVLASRRFAENYARRRGMEVDALPAITGFGHRTGPMSLAEKLKGSSESGLLFEHLARAAADARRRAGDVGASSIDVFEVHDCFTITELVLAEHLGVAEPGKGGKACAGGEFQLGGRAPINPSGGLIGGGHPVGASGVRMLWDCCKQILGRAGGYQAEGARRAQTFNIGGSFTTAVSFVVERAAQA